MPEAKEAGAPGKLDATQEINLKPGLAAFQQPEYPRLARKRGWEGVVLVEVSVDAQGRSISLKIVESSGYPVLDQAALQALQNASYTPAAGINGPVEGTLEVAVRFEISR